MEIMKTKTNMENEKILLISLLIFTFLLGIYMISVTLVNAEVPKIVPYVNDFAEVMTPEQETSLNVMLDAIEQNTTYEIAVVTVLNTEGQARVEYANKIGDENGVGKKDADNGLVILWSMENEEGGAIATGRFTESILNDAKVGRIGRESRHFFDDGLYYDGFVYIIREVQKEIGASANPSSLPAPATPIDSWVWIAVFGMIMGFIIIPMIKNFTNDFDDSDSGSYSYGGVSTLGGWGHSSGGGGGVSFGGGSFGGGGAHFLW